ncbi:MAG: hypothetical protein ACXAEN_25520 [Candidatus Thorarchaeota archaeon]|jgi:hypothetical protein
MDKRVLYLPINPKLIKKQKRGKKEFSYVEASTVSRLLDAAFGDHWSFRIKERWQDLIGDYDILFNVHGALEIVEGGSLSAVREYLASSSLRDAALRSDANPYLKWVGQGKPMTVEREGKLLSECLPSDFQTNSTSNIWKSTATDCLKKCASQFGIAAELYGEDTEGSLFKEIFTDAQKGQISELGTKLSEEEKVHIVRSEGLGRNKKALHVFNVDHYIKAAREYITDRDKEKED